MKVTILHNVTDRPLRMMDGYQRGDALVPVFRYDVPDHEGRDVFAVAGQAFHIFNVGDDPDFGPVHAEAVAYRARRNRSLSVGDVVMVGNAYLACNAIGWTALDHEPKTIAMTTHGTTWDGEVL